MYVSIAQIRRFLLKTGDMVTGKTRPSKEGERFLALLYITAINGVSPEEMGPRKPFEELVPIYPDERLTLECSGQNNLAIRLIDLIAPIGKGQRGMIVAQPKAGKTTLLKNIANGISANHPDCAPDGTAHRRAARGSHGYAKKHPGRGTLFHIRRAARASYPRS